MSTSIPSEYNKSAEQAYFDWADNLGVGVGAACNPIYLIQQAELKKRHLACINFYCFVHFSRRNLGLPVSDLASMANVDFDEIMALENDTQFKLKRDTVFGLADFFDVDKDALIDMARLDEPYFDKTWDEEPAQFPHNVGSIKELNPFEKATVDWLRSFMAKQVREKKMDPAA